MSFKYGIITKNDADGFHAIIDVSEDKNRFTYLKIWSFDADPGVILDPFYAVKYELKPELDCSNKFCWDNEYLATRETVHIKDSIHTDNVIDGRRDDFSQGLKKLIPFVFSDSKKEINTIDLLLNVSRILKQSKWIKGELARNSSGNSCSPISSEATEFCLYGAVRRAHYEIINNPISFEGTVRFGEVITDLLKTIRKKFNGDVVPGVSTYNDKIAETKDDVIGIVEQTMKRLGKNIHKGYNKGGDQPL